MHLFYLSKSEFSSWTVLPVTNDNKHHVLPPNINKVQPEPEVELNEIKNEHLPAKTVRLLKHGASKMERAAVRQKRYEEYLKQQQLEDFKHPKEKVNLFEELHKWNQMKGYTVSKGTCDRRAVVVCRNSCLKCYKRICDEFRCVSDFKNEIRKNCRRACRNEFKKEFKDIW